MILLIVFFSLFLVFLLTKGTFSPARLNALLWAALISGYYLFSPDAEGGDGLLWIAAAMIIFAVGERLGAGYAAKKCNTVKAEEKKSVCAASYAYLYDFLLLTIIIAVLGKLIFLLANGHGIFDFFSYERFMAMNADMARDRYGGRTVNYAAITLLSSFGYVAPLCGGYLWNYAGKNKKRLFLCIFSFFPILLSMAIDNTKSGVIDAAILFAIGFIISDVELHGGRSRRPFGRAIATAVALAVMFALLFAAMCVRVGDFSAETVATVKEKFVEYAFGSVEAFDVWLTKYYSHGVYGFGVNTFMAPFALLGIADRQQGVYGFIQGASSNVFSVYRGVIADFGIYGGLLFMLLLGFIGGAAYARIGSRSRFGSRFAYSAVLFTLVHGYFGSPWVYSSFWVVFAVFMLFLYAVPYERGIKKALGIPPGKLNKLQKT